MSEPDLLREIGRLCGELAQLVPHEYAAKEADWFSDGLSGRVLSKVPFKIIGVIGGLAHRALDLGRLVQELYERHKVVPGIILTRSLMETTVLLYLTCKKMKRSIETQSTDELDGFLASCLSGNRTNEADPNSPNVLTAITHLEREEGCDRYADFYNALSEFAHPNSMGTFYAYVRFNDADLTLNFGENMGLTTANDSAFSAVFALEVFIEFYKRTLTMIPEITEMSQRNYPHA